MTLGAFHDMNASLEALTKAITSEVGNVGCATCNGKIRRLKFVHEI